MLKHKIKKEEGSGLVLTLMVLLVLSVLGASVATVTMGSNRLGHATQDSNSAYYIAEAGANMAYEEIRQGVVEAYADNDKSAVDDTIDIFPKSYSDFEMQSGHQPEADIEIDGSITDGYTITSIGKIGPSSRTVTKKIVVNWKEKSTSIAAPPLFPAEAAIITNGTVTLKNKSTVNGKIHIVGDGEVDRKGNTDPHKDEIYKDNETNWNIYTLYIETSLSKIENNSPVVVASVSELNLLKEDTYIKDLIVNGEVIIDTQGKTINLIVENLEFENKARLTLAENSKVNLYVKGDIKVTGSGHKINASGHADQFAILSLTEKEIDFGSQGQEIKGLILTPNAKVSIGNGANMTGVIVAKSGDVGNGGDISYQEVTIGGNQEEKTDTDIDDLITSSPAIEK